MKDNEKAKLVNDLRYTAIEFHNYQCLREKIIGVLKKYLDRDWYIDTNYSLEGLIEDVKSRDEHIKKLKKQIEELKKLINL